MGEPARQLGSHQQGSVPQWEVEQVEEWFEVRVRPGFGRLEAVVKDRMKKQLVVVAVGSCWLTL